MKEKILKILNEYSDQMGLIIDNKFDSLANELVELFFNNGNILTKAHDIEEFYLDEKEENKTTKD